MRKTARLLKKWRKALGLDQQEAAAKLRTKSVNCSQGQVSAIERDLTVPRAKLLARIEEVCGE